MMMDIDVNGGDTVSTDFEPLPTDWYTAQAIESELQSKDNGVRLVLTWEVLEGPYAKRRVWQREWASHSSSGAQEIGQRMIRTIGKAMGLSRVDDDKALLFKPIQIRVGLEKKQEGFDQRNEVKSARPVDTAPAATTVRAPAPAATAPARPWAPAA